MCRDQQVGAIVDRDLRILVEQRAHMRGVRVEVLAAQRPDLDPMLQDKCGRHVVLGGQRVGRTQRGAGAAGLQGEHEVGGLGRDVQTGGDPDSLQRPLLRAE